MQNLIGAVSAALNGCSYCIADHREFWVKTKAGVSYPVASVSDETDADLPWYEVYWTDYLGVKRNVADLCEASQNALFGLIIDELY
jgi:hypothetical protein